MRDKYGRFIKGQHYSPHTEFKKGEHWRSKKPFYDKNWLYEEYVTKKKSANEIAKQFNVTESTIYFWLKKHSIKTRCMKEIRSTKHWAVSGKQNGMFGRCAENNPHWRGGCTAERQLFYESQEWATACSFVWKRDNATCQRCNKPSSKIIKLHVHHIVPFSIKILRAEPSNLVLLCIKCHRFVHSKKNVNKEFIKEGG